MFHRHGKHYAEMQGRDITDIAQVRVPTLYGALHIACCGFLTLLHAANWSGPAATEQLVHQWSCAHLAPHRHQCVPATLPETTGDSTGEDIGLPYVKIPWFGHVYVCMYMHVHAQQPQMHVPNEGTCKRLSVHLCVCVTIQRQRDKLAEDKLLEAVRNQPAQVRHLHTHTHHTLHRVIWPTTGLACQRQHLRVCAPSMHP